MNRIFDKNQLREIRKIYLKVTLWVLIIELISWILVILLSKDIYDPTIGKIQTMFLSFSACALLNIGAFRCMELGKRESRAFATTSLITAIIATILDIFLIWEVFPFINSDSNHFGNNSLSFGAKLILSTAVTSIAALIESNIFISSKSNKIARNIGASAVAFIYAIIIFVIIGIDLTDKLSLIITVVPFASIVIYLVAHNIARLDEITAQKEREESAKAKQEEQQNNLASKELTAKVEAEKKKAELAAQPPLQADDMTPTATSGVTINPPKTKQ